MNINTDAFDEPERRSGPFRAPCPSLGFRATRYKFGDYDASATNSVRHLLQIRHPRHIGFHKSAKDPTTTRKILNPWDALERQKIIERASEKV